MENFSTSSRPVVPWVTNAITIAVMVAATWWSNVQRPSVPAPASSLSSPVVPAAATGLQPAGSPPNSSNASNWPSQTTAVQHNGLQTVGFSSGARR